MAYDTLKAEIRQYIKTNGANEITGQVLQNVLLDMVNAYPSLDGYATQQWVQNQLSDMATMTWVGQNFVQNSSLNDYLPLSGGVMTGFIIAGELSTGSYRLGNTGLDFEYSYNGSPRYAHGIRISSVDGTITFSSRGVTGTVIDGYKITSDKFIVTNGTSSQFLKADGSVDNNTYLSSADLSGYATQTWVGQQGFLTSVPSGYATEIWVENNYLPLTGGTLTGGLNMAYSSKLNFGTSYIYQSTIPGPQGTNIWHILNFYGVDGNGYYDFDNSVHAASFIQTSDIRRKNIISDIDMTIDDIAKAPMFRFTMKYDEEAIVRVGTSAQYWQTVIPEVVSEDKRGVLSLQYDVAALAGVITVAKRVVDHEQRIAELEKENALLKEKLNIN